MQTDINGLELDAAVEHAPSQATIRDSSDNSPNTSTTSEIDRLAKSLRRYAQGDRHAFAEVLLAVEPEIRKIIRAKCMTPRMRNDFDDIAQDTLHKIVREAPKFKLCQSPMNLIRKMTRNAIADYHRRQRGYRILYVSFTSDDAEVRHGFEHLEPCARASDQLDSVPELIERLPAPLALVMRLYFFSRLQQNQIAKHLGISQAAVSDRLKKARDLLVDMYMQTIA